MEGRHCVRLVLAAVATAALAACGTVTKLPEAPPSGALTAATVGIQQTGNAPATIDHGTVKFTLDTSGSLVVQFNLTSGASSSQTVAVRASLFDATGTIIGDASGGEVMVAPHATVPFELNGPAPHGTIASTTFEVTEKSSP